MEIYRIISEMSKKAQAASRKMAQLATADKNRALAKIAELLQERKELIQAENQKDLQNGREKGLSGAMLDRLELTDPVIDSMIQGLNEVIALPDPVGEISELVKRPNGLQVGRMRVPLGVIGMIYESRPNATVDAAALCLKTGNAVILRGGSEALNSNLALAGVLTDALALAGLPEGAVQVVPITEREAVTALIQQQDIVDLIIPRGGEGLIRFVAENSRVPVLKHYKGVCHIFVDQAADLQKALSVIINSKSRPGVCNALEGLLIHQQIAEKFIPEMAQKLIESGIELFGCEKCAAIEPKISRTDELWGTEFLDMKLCVKVVDDYEQARQYIDQYGSRHTEVIITEDYSLAHKFVQEIDASAVMVNASTRFNDGGQLGLGAEIGISTTKLHAYGPMGLKELTTRKFVVYGQGQVRE